MGYTHYWTIKRAIPAKAWSAIMADTRQLLASTVTPLAADFDRPDELPDVNPQEIRFNGIGAAGHETFLLSPHAAAFEFCKTNGKPYDTMVAAVLIVAAKHAGRAIEVSSDGEAMDWAAPLGLVRAVLGDAYRLPIKVTA